MPRIDGPLLRKAIILFANSKSCAGDHVVAKMLNVLDEDVLASMAETFEQRIRNLGSGAYIGNCGARPAVRGMPVRR